MNQQAMPIDFYGNEPEQTTWPAVHPAFEKKLDDHMDLEHARELREAAEKAALIARLDAGSKKMAELAEELAPVKKMYYALLGSGGVGGFLILLLIFIYQADRSESKADRADVKQLASSVYEISTSTKIILERQRVMEVEQERIRQRLERWK